MLAMTACVHRTDEQCIRGGAVIEPTGIVVARRATELAGGHQQHPVRQPSLVEIGEERSQRRVEVLHQCGVAAAVIVVGVEVTVHRHVHDANPLIAGEQLRRES